MIINNNIQSIAGIYSNHSSNNKIAKAGREEEKRDEIHISQTGQNVREMLQKMNEMDDVRHDRVAELENLIASGNYHVSCSAVSDWCGNISQERWDA